MIFLTVGTQLPFERLVKAADAWAARNPAEEVIGQIGDSAYAPCAMQWRKQMDADIFRSTMERADVILSHAGVGNVLMALELQKPIIILPRLAAMGEHRNDHQLATAKWLQDKPGVTVIHDIAELDKAITTARQNRVEGAFGPHASPELLGAVTAFIAKSAFERKR